MRHVSKPMVKQVYASIAAQILVVRGRRVLLDADLAALYGVKTEWLNEQVRRNLSRFPADFAFRMPIKELHANRPQFAGGSAKHRNPRILPWVFTEHGAIMAATVLNSPQAIEMSVYVVRAFVKLRELVASNVELARKLEALEKSVATLDERGANGARFSLRLLHRAARC